jgi:hypothetical protein
VDHVPCIERISQVEAREGRQGQQGGKSTTGRAWRRKSRRQGSLLT